MEYAWHLSLALEMIKIARESKCKTAAYALLVAFEHLVDAYASREGKHFHEEYLIDAWRDRLEWMREHNMLDRYDGFVYALNKVIEGEGEYVKYMLEIVECMIQDRGL